MAGVLNNSARPITLNCKIKKTGRVIKHRLNPMDFKTIPDGEWNLLKKSKVVQGYLDKGDLVSGKKKPVELPDDFEPEDENKGLSDAEIAEKNQKAIDDLDNDDLDNESGDK